MSYIELKNIKKSFGDKEVLKNVSISIEEGEFVTFLGSSGCGKTTMLRCLAGLESIDEGNILLDGQDITNLPARQRGISMVFQQYSLFPTMNLFDNVSFGLKMSKVSKDEIKQRVEEVVKIVNLEEHLDKYPNQLSGGEQQRAALARCLIMKPKVLLLDEPFSAIDAKLRKELQVHLKQIHQKLNMTTVFVTHDQEEAMRMSDTIQMFHDGKVEQSGSPYDIYMHPKTLYATKFIGSYNLLNSNPPTNNSDNDKTAKIAFRPEVVEIAAEKFEEDESVLSLEGTVANCLLQGSMTRYFVETETSEQIMVDKISESSEVFSLGQHVYLQIKNDNVLTFDEEKA